MARRRTLKILVTGGAGFIGSHLVRAFVRDGHAVRVLDDFSSGTRRNLREVARSIDVLKGDCADPRTAARAAEGIDVVYHEAAVPSVALSVADPAGSHRADATATLQMLLAARHAGVRRFGYAGSSSVYGDPPEQPKTESMAVSFQNLGTPRAWSRPMVGTGTATSRSTAIAIGPAPLVVTPRKPPSTFLECTAPSLSSSAGCSEPIREECSPGAFPPISTSSCSATTGGARGQ